MSSSAFSANLTPEPWLRIIVVLSAQMLGFAGCLVLLVLPAAAPIRLLTVLLWIALVARQLRRLQRGQQSCRAIRVLAGGHIELQTAEADWQPATLMEGSVMLQDIAWLRLDGAPGGQFAELLSRNGQDEDDWRRLSVIWRHIGAAE